jgi:hypothetical protein
MFIHGALEIYTSFACKPQIFIAQVVKLESYASKYCNRSKTAHNVTELLLNLF